MYFSCSFLQTIKQMKNENDFIKAKNVRMEDENIVKSRKIDELLNPELQVIFFFGCSTECGNRTEGKVLMKDVSLSIFNMCS